MYNRFEGHTKNQEPDITAQIRNVFDRGGRIDNFIVRKLLERIATEINAGAQVESDALLQAIIHFWNEAVKEYEKSFQQTETYHVTSALSKILQINHPAAQEFGVTKGKEFVQLAIEKGETSAALLYASEIKDVDGGGQVYENLVRQQAESMLETAGDSTIQLRSAESYIRNHLTKGSDLRGELLQQLYTKRLRKESLPYDFARFKRAIDFLSEEGVEGTEALLHELLREQLERDVTSGLLIYAETILRDMERIGMPDVDALREKVNRVKAQRAAAREQHDRARQQYGGSYRFGGGDQRQARAQSGFEALKSYYAVLGVEAGADPDTIKKAFRAKMKKYHPDVVRPALIKAKQAFAENPTDENRKAMEAAQDLFDNSESMTVRIAQAYDALKKRAA